MVSSDDRKLDNAVGGVSVRACDNCVRKKARWYCAADDAFLCESCDSSIHSANPLARRHERVRLKTGGSIRSNSDDESGLGLDVSVPSWHRGVTRKARTPRLKRHTARICHDDETFSGISNPSHLVPEICSEECTCQENDERLLHRVPVFDPLVAELCASAAVKGNTQDDAEILQGFGDVPGEPLSNEFSQEMDLAEFAADFESLLSKGIEDEWFDIEGFVLSHCDAKDIERAVKIEDANDEEFRGAGRERFQLNLGDYNEGGDTKALPTGPKLLNKYEGSEIHVAKKICLRLDYNGVMSAWDGQKSPWTTGQRPALDSSTECWPYCLGMCGGRHGEENTVGVMSGGSIGDGGREARVMRYREKRRTRLFSKKIRYQVRKLNAEKRPRIRGRFVKRPNFGLHK